MRYSRVLAVALIGFSFSTERAVAAGFEKITMWSGKHAGMAGAAVSNVEGAEGLFFNPAALQMTKGLQLTLDFSPTFAQYSGPITAPGQDLTSTRPLSPFFAALASYQFNEQLGFGVGGYVSGGTKAIYEDVPFPTAPTLAIRPTVKSDLNVIELAAGVGYQPMSGFRIGGAWRIVMVNASVGTVQPILGGSRYAALTLDNMDATSYGGFKFGAQYQAPEKSWGLGAMVRTSIEFTAEGTSSGVDDSAVSAADTPAAITGGPVSATNTFPLQIALGGYLNVVPDKFRMIVEYAWTQYDRNQTLTINGTATSSTGTPFAIASIPQSWQNQSNLRVGFEYMGWENLTLRAGYGYTSQVTPASTARATFSSPGTGNTITAGAGTAFGALDADIAGEYSFASGTVTNEQPITGEYKTNAFAIHLGLSYHL